MKIGVIGLPNVGKSTLFNAITNAKAESANYPFCTIEPNIGVVNVYDKRLEILGKLYNTQKITPASIEFLDIAGLVSGASKGEGLGNKFLGHIREVDAIAHVVRCFDNDNIIHINGTVNPARDIEIVNIELILADLETVNKKYEKTSKLVKIGDKTAIEEYEVLTKIKPVLEMEKPVRSINLSPGERKIVDSFFLLSAKPIIYIANVSESDIGLERKNKYVQIVEEIAQKEGAEVIALSARIEEELSALTDDEKTIFKEELGIKQGGLEKLVIASYSLLGLMSFLTAGEKEVRAWTIQKGTKAPQAAGKIHTDFEKGFIKAEVVKYDDLIECGTYLAAKEKGKVRIEGKDYIVQDGDIMLFRFNL